MKDELARRAEYYAQKAIDAGQELSSLRHKFRLQSSDLKMYRWLALTGWVCFVIAIFEGM